ncbi:CRISPR-associated endonuclease Cas2 [Chitinivibrio alkaliphilus]|uniref:CRISPR-associated endoribonuclease Cas2 n=1 Tax=Chitinivibrio alkaliphilus ACht1 TaxID=1313304 RepID=U7D5C4_9BACT|nr:CRISPR-associated endonuclease Cas2 [Chitinivibrio alkaliphilus]ERP30766.1 CRISPR/Cas system-associated protein Cas2 [Chitinivibrio alkaliphilus ACht1]
MTDSEPKHYVIIYDISDSRRLSRVARILEDSGIRYQKSVFELYIKLGQLLKIKQDIQAVIDAEEDSVIVIPVCEKDWQKQVKYGSNAGIKEDDGTFKLL